MKVYTNKCPTCGLNGVRVKRLKAQGAEIIETKNNPEALKEHIELLKHSGIGTSPIVSIVVEEGVITRLEDWKQ